jgi:hypothetical protein
LKEALQNASANDSLKLPAGLARAEGAAPLVTEALRKGLKLQVQDKETRQFIAKLLLAEPELLKVPQWDLLESVEDLPLAEAMIQRFPQAESSDWSRRKAEQILLVGRIIDHKHAEALKGLLQDFGRSSEEEIIHNSVLSALNSKNIRNADPLRPFLETSLKALPTLPLWDTYVRHMATKGHAKDALSFMETLIRESPKGGFTRRLIEAHLPEALLAANEVDRGVAALRARLTAPAQPAATLNDTERADLTARLQSLGVGANPKLIERLSTLEGDSDHASAKLSQALKLTELGRLLKHPEWVNEGLVALATAVASKAIASGAKASSAVPPRRTSPSACSPNWRRKSPINRRCTTCSDTCVKIRSGIRKRPPPSVVPWSWIRITSTRGKSSGNFPAKSK